MMPNNSAVEIPIELDLQKFDTKSFDFSEVEQALKKALGVMSKELEEISNNTFANMDKAVKSLGPDGEKQFNVYRQQIYDTITALDNLYEQINSLRGQSYVQDQINSVESAVKKLADEETYATQATEHFLNTHEGEGQIFENDESAIQHYVTRLDELHNTLSELASKDADLRKLQLMPDEEYMRTAIQSFITNYSNLNARLDSLKTIYGSLTKTMSNYSDTEMTQAELAENSSKLYNHYARVLGNLAIKARDYNAESKGTETSWRSLVIAAQHAAEEVETLGADLNKSGDELEKYRLLLDEITKSETAASESVFDQQTQKEIDTYQKKLDKLVDKFREFSELGTTPKAWERLSLQLTDIVDKITTLSKELGVSDASIRNITQDAREAAAAAQLNAEAETDLRSQNAELKQAETSLRSYTRQLETAMQTYQNYANYDASDKQFDRLNIKLSALVEHIRDVASVLGYTDDEIEELVGDAESAIGDINSRLDTQVTMSERLSGAWSSIKQLLSSFGKVAKVAFNVMIQGVKKALNVVKKLSSTLLKLINTVNSAIPKMAGQVIGKLFGAVKTFYNYLKRYIARRLIFNSLRSIANVIKEEFQAMAKQIPEINVQLSSLMQGFNQLKGAVVAAFQPIISYAIPIIMRLISSLNNATESLGRFFATLTGQGYTYKFVANPVNYAQDEADKESSKKAKSDAEKEYESYVKKINNLKEKANKMNALGTGTENQWKNLQYEAEEYSKKLTEISSKIEGGAANLSSYTNMAEQISSMAEQHLTKIAEKTKETNEETKDLKKSLASFDTLDILDNPNSNDNEDDIDTTVDDAMANISDAIEDTLTDTVDDAIDDSMTGVWTKVAIENGISNLAEMIKKAWAQGDFTDVGTELGNRLKKALDNAIESLNGHILEKSEKVARSLGQTLQGFITVPELGNTIGSALVTMFNNAFKTVDAFLTSVSWFDVGEFCKDIIKGINKDFDKDAVGHALGDMLLAAINLAWSLTNDPQIFIDAATNIAGAINKFMETLGEKQENGQTGWKNLGEALHNALHNAIIFATTLFNETDINEFIEGLKEMISGLDVDKLNDDLFNLVNSILDTLISILDTVDWETLGIEVGNSLEGNLSKAGQIIKKLGTIFKTLLLGAIAFLKGAAVLSELGDRMTEVITSISEYTHSEEAKGAFGSILLAAVVGGIAYLGSAGAVGLISASAGTPVTGIARVMALVFVNAWQGISTGAKFIGTIGASLWGALKNAWLFTLLPKITTFFTVTLPAKLGVLMTGITAVMTSPITAIVAVGVAIVALIANWEDVKEAVKLFGEEVSIRAKNIKAKLTEIKDAIKESLHNVIDKAKEKWQLWSESVNETLENMRTKLGEVADKTKEKFWSIATSIGNFFIGIINHIIDALNKINIPIPDWLPGIGGKNFGFNINHIAELKVPKLAQGAVIPANKPFLAALGDQKSGTNIEAPLSTIKQALAEVLAVNGLDVDVNVSFEGTLAALARVLVPAIEVEQRRQGKLV